MPSSNRHIYNNSDQSWTFLKGPGDNHGNIWFSGDGSGAAENGPWVVPPHSTASIQYTSEDGLINGNWKIVDHLGVDKSFWYHNIIESDDVYITHDGNTGAVSLNDPANGDLAVGGSNW